MQKKFLSPLIQAEKIALLIFPMKVRVEYIFKDEIVTTRYTLGMALQFETSGSVICKNILMLVCEL